MDKYFNQRAKLSGVVVLTKRFLLLYIEEWLSKQALFLLREALMTYAFIRSREGIMYGRKALLALKNSGSIKHLKTQEKAVQGLLKETGWLQGFTGWLMRRKGFIPCFVF